MKCATYPVLYGNCKLVRGINRSVICDLETHKLYFIPNDLYNILRKYKGKTIIEICAIYDNKYNDIIYGYFEFLEKANLLQFVDDINSFPEISENWFNSSEITNSIVDFNSINLSLVDSIVDQLNELNCKNVQFRFFNEESLPKVESVLNIVKFKKSVINSIDLFLCRNSCYSKSDYVRIAEEFPRISNIVIFESDSEEFIMLDDKAEQLLVYRKELMKSEKNCGNITNENNPININSFTESLTCNSCLNRKISIDSKGNIKNCPSMSESFGNIAQTSLATVLKKEEFKKYWNITKDKIEVCKECELRYICTDCRAYVENPNNIYSKPLKCGYNPITNEWTEWSSDPLKQKAINYYGMKDFL